MEPAKTITHSENAKGWTSFHSFIPDMMAKLNNKFFSIKAGQLWRHHDIDNPVRCNYYGVQYQPKLVFVFADENADDKIFKTLVQEGNLPWAAALRTNYTQSTIKQTEFNKYESRYFGYIRKNEDATDLRGHASQGIGVIIAEASGDVSFRTISELVSIGDNLYQMNGNTQELIGEITDIQPGVISVATVITAPMVGLYCFAKKNSRIEGSEIRGNFLEVTLTSSETGALELLAVDTNAVKSYI